MSDDFFPVAILSAAALSVIAGFLFLFWVISVGTGQEYAGYFGFAFLTGIAVLFVAAGIS